jgi:hypothetical protein
MALSQSYGTSVGLRLSNGDDFRMGGITMQQRIFNKVTLEGIAQTDFRHNHTAHILAERHKNIITKRLNFYVGAGLSGGLEENSLTLRNPDETITITSYNNATMGIDLIAGLEFTLLSYTVSLDYKPNFNLKGRDLWYQGQVGISVRGVLVKGSTWNKHKQARQKEKNKKERGRQANSGKEYPSIGEFFNSKFQKPEK